MFWKKSSPFIKGFFSGILLGLGSSIGFFIWNRLPYIWDIWKSHTSLNHSILRSLPTEKVDPDTLLIYAAVPDKVILNQIFSLAVTIRQLISPLFAEEQLLKVKSGSMQIQWPETESYIPVRIHISAPDCKIESTDSASFRLYRNFDSPIFYFHLRPKRSEKISVIITAYWEKDWLGSVLIQTDAHEEFVGSVKTKIFHTIQYNIDSDGNPAVIYQVNKQNLLIIQNMLRRLQKLQEVQALKGLDTEPHILIEIEDIEKQLYELQRLTD